ncbi:MAG: OmpA family protein [Pseudodesulfovibrio sp.]
MNGMHDKTTREFTSFEQFEGGAASGMHDWAVPWSDLMMVMFVLFVVLFVYADSHQDVKVLFSRDSAEKAQAASTLDPLIGLIGQISSRAGGAFTSDAVRVADNRVLFRSRASGVTVVRENGRQVRVILRGKLFFDAGQKALKADAGQYLEEVAEVVRLSVGMVHVIGYASADEVAGGHGFDLSSGRAADAARHLMEQFGVDPQRIVITGRGAYHPELPDTSADNLALNRRVEIVITNQL